MRVLVTGSAGLLGSVTVKYFSQMGFGVTGVDIVASPTTSILIDIKDKKAIELVLPGHDAVIHTAAIHGKHYELNYPRHSFVDTNITGTLNLLEACVVIRWANFCSPALPLYMAAPW